MNNSKNILLFDGICALCNWVVRLILCFDKLKLIKFATLQSKAGLKILNDNQLQNLNLSSIVLITPKKAFIKSQAVFEVLRILGGAWKCFLIFSWLPVSITDYFYDLIAKFRYKIFGKYDNCKLPSEQEKSRFIEDGF